LIKAEVQINLRKPLIFIDYALMYVPLLSFRVTRLETKSLLMKICKLVISLIFNVTEISSDIIQQFCILNLCLVREYVLNLRSYVWFSMLHRFSVILD